MQPALVIPQLPADIGGFRVIARLGCGGMAEVFLARRTCVGGFERQVVVKRMLPHLAQQQELVHALVDEGRVLARMRHPNIVAVEEIGHDDHAFFLVMEHLRGSTLSSIARELRTKSQRFDLALAAHVVSEIASALHYAHELRDERGVPLKLVHRDVSPHNVFLTIHGEVKLLDFGIAHYADRDSRTQTGVAKGKLAYMAPEQFAGAPPDRRVDVFALGVILHELLSGRRLFSRPNDVEVVQAVLELKIPRPSEVSRGVEVPRSLEDVCMRALARSPDERFQTAAGFRTALRAALRELRPPPDLSDRVAELATVYAAEREDRKPAPPPQTATLPEVPWVVSRNPLLPSESDIEVALDVLDATRARERAPRTTHIRLPLVSNRPWAAIGIALALALASLGVLLAIPSRPLLPALPQVGTESDDAPSSQVEIRFESTPVGAEVRIGDRLVGHTPTFLEVRRGDEALPVRIALEGHAAVEHTVVPDRPRTLRVHLHPDE